MKKVLLTILVALLAGVASAQITYTNWRLNINKAPSHKFMDVLIDEWNGFYWTCKDTNFFQLDVSPVNPRIAGSGDKVVFYNSTTQRYNSIEVSSVYNHSDARSKKDVQPISTGLSTILGLKPVSYHWKSVDEDEEVISPRKVNGYEESDSVKVAYGPEGETELQYGFLAQDVEQILPEAVATDDSGNKMVNYISLIPFLVQSIQELQQTVENQAVIISTLTGNQFSATASQAPKGKIVGCTPNPTSGMVRIEIEIDDKVEDAKIVIANLSGSQEKVMALTPDKLTVDADVSRIPSGVHIVTLLVDGKVADSCRLVRQ